MDSPSNKNPFSATAPPPGLPTIEPAISEEFLLPIRTDRLYQIAALAAGLIFLVTAL
ncbi:MAG: hypothetical protein ABI380_02075 [Edaphobacter sp.]